MRSFLISIAVIFCGHAFSQNSEQEVIKNLTINDSIFWRGYNTCNLQMMSQFLTKDMEFFHDKGGIILGIDGMTKSMSENICNDPKNKVRRELVPGTHKIFLLRNGDAIYGAIISGDHFFYSSYDGAKETKNGVAKFTNLWILVEGKWKMNRILSFDHKEI